MSKIVSYMAGLAVIAIVTLSLLYSCERHTATKAVAEAQVATKAAQTLSQNLTEAHASYRVDLDAIQKAQSQKDILVSGATKVKEKVDAVAAKVEAGQLSDDAADDAYVDSMWEAYCQGSNDLACASRHPSK